MKSRPPPPPNPKFQGNEAEFTGKQLEGGAARHPLKKARPLLTKSPAPCPTSRA